MDSEFLESEIVSLLHASKLTKDYSAKALDSAHKKAYPTITRLSCCPYCRAIFSFEEPTVSLFVESKCVKCTGDLFMVTGVVKSKRFNSSFFSSEKGLYIRFVDCAMRERYAALWGFSKSVELKSKDVFSLCIGADSETVTQNKKSIRGKATVSNLTLNNEPVFGEFWEINELLHALQGKTFNPTVEDITSVNPDALWK